jgi:hypothetical protein
MKNKKSVGSCNYEISLDTLDFLCVKELFAAEGGQKMDGSNSTVSDLPYTIPYIYLVSQKKELQQASDFLQTKGIKFVLKKIDETWQKNKTIDSIELIKNRASLYLKTGAKTENIQQKVGILLRKINSTISSAYQLKMQTDAMNEFLLQKKEITNNPKKVNFWLRPRNNAIKKEPVFIYFCFTKQGILFENNELEIDLLKGYTNFTIHTIIPYKNLLPYIKKELIPAFEQLSRIKT